MKKILCLLFALGIILINTVDAFGKECESTKSWYCIRCGTSQPPITREEQLLHKYGAVSVDRAVSDKSPKKVLYLTFDAGYENGNVKRILDVLSEKNVTGAFFILDNIIIKDTDVVLRMADEGHLVCNHTRCHKNISSYSKEEIFDDLSSLEYIYYEKTGRSMEKIFRYPEGKYSESSLKHLNELGYKTVFWSFAYDDWDNNRQMSAERAYQKVISNTHNGAIILLHPTSETNVRILPRLIDEWRNMGYSFGSLKDI